MTSRIASTESAATQAEALFEQGHFAEAREVYLNLAAETHVVDYEYDDWLRRLVTASEKLGRHVEAGLVYLYLHQLDHSKRLFGDESIERARVLECDGDWFAAAQIFQAHNMDVQSAVCLEKANKIEDAAKGWSKVLNGPAIRGMEYESALASFNLGMAQSRLQGRSVGESGSQSTKAQQGTTSDVLGQKALIESQRKLEQVADGFESRGERERAFDCYHILLKLGRDSGQFENLAEGYINCIRVLKADNLKFYVLQYYEDFIALALEHGELHAAASLYQEAAEYTARAGLPYGETYIAKAAATWEQCGDKYASEDAPLDMVENAYVAAIQGYSAVSQLPLAKSALERLASLNLSEKKKAKYLRLADEYSAVSSNRRQGPSFPDHLKQQAYADIWFIDLVEWELGGDPYQVALSIIGDLRYPNSIRRRALVVALILAKTESIKEAPTETVCRVAELLGELQTYAALRPLEFLFENFDSEVQRAVVLALRFLFFKRTFVLVHRALQSEDEEVREAAAYAISGLHFPHAFNSLVRIFEQSDDAAVRAAALESVGKIQSVEAGEFLLTVIRQEGGALHTVAKTSLRGFDNHDIVPIVRQHLEIENDAQVKEALEGVLQSFARTMTSQK